MGIVELVVAGILSTLAMTIFTEIAFGTVKRPYHVLRILGNMLQFRKTTSISSIPPVPMLLLANIVHYTIGIFFTIGYHLIIAKIDGYWLLTAIVYGVMIAVIAVIGWRLFFSLHPGPPPVALSPYLSVISLGHVVLSLVTYGLLLAYGKPISG